MYESQCSARYRVFYESSLISLSLRLGDGELMQAYIMDQEKMINLLYDSYSMTMISHRHLVNTWKQIRKSADSPEPYAFITLCFVCVATKITR